MSKLDDLLAQVDDAELRQALRREMQQPVWSKPTQRLELVWANKEKFLLVPRDDTGKPVWVDRDHPAACEVHISDFTGQVGEVSKTDPYSDNLLFTGDSLDVLRILCEVPEYRQHYRGKVKCIYIDPPFNTGQTFEHYDDWMEHSTWLSFMRDRLLLIKELLSPDGSIWIHLDDAEQHRMRALLDEVFGTQNFVCNVIWQKSDSPRMDAKGFSVSHDIITVYRKSDAFALNRLVVSGALAHYDKTDADGNLYYTKPLRASGGQGDSREARPNLYFAMRAPDGTEVFPVRPDGTDGAWRWGQEKVAAEGSRIEWVRTRDGGWNPYYRIYAQENTLLPPQTIWTHAEVGSNRTSAAESKALTVAKFATPKPEALVARVVHIASNEGDIILDCFGGSGTTAAVAHKMGRRWLTVEILPATVQGFTQPRLEKVVDGSDAGGVSGIAEWAGGGGFRTVDVGPPMYELTPYGVLLAEWATNGRFSRAVAGQLGFEFQQDAAPFCGVRGRMRLAVLDGAVGIEETLQIVSALSENERVTIVAQVVLPGVEEFLRENSRGSRVRKAPRDLLGKAPRRRRKAGNV